MTDKEKAIYNIVVIKEMIKIRSNSKNLDEKLEKIGLNIDIIDNAVRNSVLSSENIANIINKSTKYGFKKEYFYTNKNCELIINDNGIQDLFESYQDGEIDLIDFRNDLELYYKKTKNKYLNLLV